MFLQLLSDPKSLEKTQHFLFKRSTLEKLYVQFDGSVGQRKCKNKMVEIISSEDVPLKSLNCLLVFNECCISTYQTYCLFLIFNITILSKIVIFQAFWAMVLYPKLWKIQAFFIQPQHFGKTIPFFGWKLTDDHSIQIFALTNQITSQSFQITIQNCCKKLKIVIF
eukprot:TRINITY_DN2500_c0_g1_i7.p2 TRINITY_DN2500_c0_g1~~TRINITY_DN2500_c0_g1_i7.p2  ORF type:complete len:166 (-),score=1.10 TRINITY_DN2500_c0_g1_i7:481-978(-)